MTTIEYLDAVKTAKGLTSDYQLAKLLGFPLSSVSSYRTGRRFFDDEAALTVAQVLHLNPLVVIAAANAERAKTAEQKARWMEVVEKFSVSFRSLLSQWDGRERRAQSRLFMQ
jgi:hypothetical protein